jgi:hypothetical protein
MWMLADQLWIWMWMWRSITDALRFPRAILSVVR